MRNYKILNSDRLNYHNYKYESDGDLNERARSNNGQFSERVKFPERGEVGSSIIGRANQIDRDFKRKESEVKN